MGPIQRFAPLQRRICYARSEVFLSDGQKGLSVKRRRDRHGLTEGAGTGSERMPIK